MVLFWTFEFSLNSPKCTDIRENVRIFIFSLYPGDNQSYLNPAFRAHISKYMPKPWKTQTMKGISLPIFAHYKLTNEHNTTPSTHVPLPTLLTSDDEFSPHQPRTADK
jgi:hypothetical protein